MKLRSKMLLTASTAIVTIAVLLAGCAPTAQPSPAAAPAKAPADVAPAAQPKPAAPVSSSSKEPVVIGVIAEMTGSQVVAGEPIIASVKMAVEEWNAKGGIKGRPIEVAVEDNASTPPGTVNAFNKLMSTKKPVAIMGPMLTVFLMAMEPMLKGAGVPVLVGASGAVLTSGINPWFLRILPSDPLNGKIAADYAVKDLGFKKIGIIHVTGDFGQSGAANLKENLQKLGATVVGTEAYNATDKDMTAQLLNLQRAGAELVIGWSYAIDGGMIMTNMQQLGVKMKLLGSVAFINPEALKIAGPAANGLVAVNNWHPRDDAETKAWIKKTEERQKQPANYINAGYYDGTNILLRAIETAGTDPAAIRKAIVATRGYKGITGEYNFDERGEGVHQGYMSEVKGGQVVLIKEVKAE